MSTLSAPKATTIDEVIDILEDIIQEAAQNQDPLGYFAVLYQRVTIKVKEGIAEGFFDDGPRMERLDVVFAGRYIDAYYAYRNHQPLTHSWEEAFARSHSYWPIVLQHLLLGINAHINLDLGIAAAQITRGSNIQDLENDFRKINAILSSLVEEVQDHLSAIWPRLRRILRRTKQLDNRLVDFSMELARDGAWRFAQQVASCPPDTLDQFIAGRDQKIAEKVAIIVHDRWSLRLLFGAIRIGERGSVAGKIGKLRGLGFSEI